MQLSQRHVNSTPTSPPSSGGIPTHQMFSPSPPNSGGAPIFAQPYGQETHNIQIEQPGGFSVLSPPTSQGKPGASLRSSQGAAGPGFQPAVHSQGQPTRILDPSQPTPRRPTSATGKPGPDFAHNELFSTVAQVTENPLARMMFQQAGAWSEDAKNKGIEGVRLKLLILGFYSTAVLQITKYLQATNLKYYFDINNSYVPNKLKVILCPVLHKVIFGITLYWRSLLTKSCLVLEAANCADPRRSGRLSSAKGGPQCSRPLHSRYVLRHLRYHHCLPAGNSK